MTREIVQVKMTREERHDVSVAIYEFASRIGRGDGAGAKKRATRFGEIARAISGIDTTGSRDRGDK